MKLPASWSESGASNINMRKLFIWLMAVSACSCQLGKLSLEEEVEKRLEEVLANHMDAWSKMEKGLEGAREGRSGFPTIKRKRKKIRGCQNMAGKFLFSFSDILYLQESSAVQMLSTSSTLLRQSSPWWSTSTTTSTTTTTI